jgi:hypothetical protein
MLIHSEPNGFFMVRYKLYFNQQTPDPEDAWVQTYLQEHGLEPRRQLDETHEGVPYKVFHFGQCYLGRHVEALGKLYQHGVEQSALAQHLEQLLGATDDAAVPTMSSQEVAAALAAELHAAAQFTVTAEGELQVSIDPAMVTTAVQARQLRL